MPAILKKENNKNTSSQITLFIRKQKKRKTVFNFCLFISLVSVYVLILLNYLIFFIKFCYNHFVLKFSVMLLQKLSKNKRQLKKHLIEVKILANC